MRRCSGKANKLKYIYTIWGGGGAPRDMTIQEREINNIKIKIIPFTIYAIYILEETVSSLIDKFKSKYASVSEAYHASEAFTLFS